MNSVVTVAMNVNHSIALLHSIVSSVNLVQVKLFSFGCSLSAVSLSPALCCLSQLSSLLVQTDRLLTD